jgi:hypothetical protein
VKNNPGESFMIFYIVYVLAIIVLIMHFTGWLARRNMEWLVLTTPVAVFAVIILDYMKII